MISGRMDQVAGYPLPLQSPAISGETKYKTNLKNVVDIMAEIKANSLDWYLIVIPTLWYCWYF